MTFAKPLAVIGSSALALTFALAAPAVAQQMPQGAPSAEQQVAQLDELVNLDDSQEQELVALLTDGQERLQSLQAEAQGVQMQIHEQIGPEFDEAAIRRDAERLGQLTGDMTAESALMQARIQSTLTAEQRDELERLAEEQEAQMRQMQEQMQQQQMPAE
ncbi:Spy/CpxP family protein refolding chaperone [Halomonas alkalicola]|uniref:Spy/CpxP family protein refolding chaperone n=1 Tax=Halomonas alkalicola TaxID=1930622 RepID=A0ABY9H625_9GAMM|nr:Spy/CpxP family protein refolding chaperone [Halomonas alkalicola]WLI73648.1 Spy/CpxP family protein refolding chaperone [Halomonas alkalicola]